MKTIAEEDDILAQIFFNRNITTEQEKNDFLNPEYEQLRDPFLLKNMDIAVSRLVLALKEKHRIVIFGDYDVDGCTATAILYRALRSYGGSVSYYIPDRMKEGYGMTKVAIDHLIDRGTDLIITVDNGTASYDEVGYAKEHNIDVIITDHHEVTKEVPQALAVINPKQLDDPYPFEGICGATVAFKLVCALTMRLGEKDDSIRLEQLKWYLDLVAIGTVADVMPLIDENRILVKYGLMVLKKTRNPGIKAIAKVAGIELEKVDVRTIGFAFAPRINAAGRMTHAENALKLLLTDNPAEAEMLALRLEQLNRQRQETVKSHIDNVKLELYSRDKIDSVLVLHDASWTSGILGLIAGRVSEEFSRPVFCLAEEGGMFKGSARSSVDFHIVEAMKAVSETLVKFGGHKQAGGFTVTHDHYEIFKQSLISYGDLVLHDDNKVREIQVDAEIDTSRITKKLFRDLQKLQPFGQKNPDPVFAAHAMLVTETKLVGADLKHLKITLKDSHNNTWKGIAFSVEDEIKEIERGERVDIAFSIQENEWKGVTNLECMIHDIRRSKQETT
ncbi:MAG: single-stranded-DNA-specific exonuclease RecJ [Patescibacteria group bacterium]